jgi:hypothetical protein
LLPTKTISNVIIVLIDPNQFRNDTQEEEFIKQAIEEHKIKNLNKDFRKCSDALTNMKERLEDELIDNDIKNDEEIFVNTDLDLQFTERYILVVHEDSIRGKAKFEAVIPKV